MNPDESTAVMNGNRHVFVWHEARLVEKKEKAFAQEIWFISDIPVYAKLRCVVRRGLMWTTVGEEKGEYTSDSWMLMESVKLVRG